MYVWILLSIFILSRPGDVAEAWSTIPTPISPATISSKSLTFVQRNNNNDHVRRKLSGLFLSSIAAETEGISSNDDDDEYEYIEYENLTEKDFAGSEWLVGTNWDRKSDEIDETWVRLAVKDGKNIAIWGDDAEGTWELDVASQFLSVSKEYRLSGKEIWAGIVDDYYFQQGTVRGWKYWASACVEGQWQAKRLGVDPEEAGTAPWFESTVDDDSTDNTPSES